MVETVTGHAHNYAALYAFLFEQFRREEFSMLEIGLLVGGIEAGNPVGRYVHDVPSIRMWTQYFPRATVYGFDISDFSHIKFDRFRFLRGDLSSTEDLDYLARELPTVRIVVDDGSHASYHQQLAFTRLFDKVQPGGFYVIEDLHWQPPFENTLPDCPKTAKIVERYLETGILQILGVDYASKVKNMFVHRNSRGGVTNWTLKTIVIQKV